MSSLPIHPIGCH